MPTRLATRYLGLDLRSPLVVSSSPLTMSLDNLRAMEDAGAGAAVLGSLFEEKIRHDASAPYLEQAEGDKGSPLYLPGPEDYSLGPHEYLDYIQRAKDAVGMPVIASLNSGSIGAWVQYADLIEKAGADALELNLYLLPSDPEVSGAQVERDYIDIVQAVRLATELPLAVKLGPWFTSLPAMAHALQEAGAAGLVLFHRFYQPDLDLESLTVRPRMALSSSSEIGLSLRWIGLLYGQAGLDLAGSGGVHTAEDVLKLVAAGASVATMCSALLRHGIGHLARVRTAMEVWLDRHGVELDELRGKASRKAVGDPAGFERANYVEALNRFR